MTMITQNMIVNNPLQHAHVLFQNDDHREEVHSINAVGICEDASVRAEIFGSTDHVVPHEHIDSMTHSQTNSPRQYVHNGKTGSRYQQMINSNHSRGSNKCAFLDTIHSYRITTNASGSSRR